MGIGQIDLKRQYAAIRDEVERAVTAVLESGQYIGGEEVEAFEREAAAYCDVDHAIACANGTDAIMLSLIGLDIGPGDEVITTPFTFFGTVSPIVHRGATPVFADIDPASFCLDPDKVVEALTPRTKAIMPVHLYGNMHGMGEIAKIAWAHSIPLIADAAQSVGARWARQGSGAYCRVATFSFYPTKNLAAAGDGGMMTTNDAALAERLRSLRNHGEREKYTHHEFGFNSRLDAIQAAILRVKLRHLEEWIEARREVANRYDALFKERGLAPGYITIPARPDDDGEINRHVFHQYTIRCGKREALREHLSGRGIGTGVHYPKVVYKQPAFEKLKIEPQVCPNAEAATAEVLSLPMFAELTEAEQREVVGAIEEFYL